VAFDFDGTLTDPWPIAEAFERALREAVARRAGLSSSELEGAWRQSLEDERRDEAGWDFLYDGAPAAPARADPWLRASVRGRRALALALGEAQLEAQREQWLVEAFGEAYASAPARWRDETPVIIEALLSRGVPVFVVSNSPADALRDRLRSLGEPLARGISVLGGAQKFSLAPPSHPRAQAWAERVPERQRFEGARREVRPRRGHFMDALARVCDEARVEPGELLFCGDVFELDLAATMAVGARVHFVLHQGAAEWERRAVLAHPGASAAEGLPRELLLGDR
jgi:FMN phosphatase YigB (HAD superfamily)